MEYVFQFQISVEVCETLDSHMYILRIKSCKIPVMAVSQWPTGNKDWPSFLEKLVKTWTSYLSYIQTKTNKPKISLCTPLDYGLKLQVLDFFSNFPEQPYLF